MSGKYLAFGLILESPIVLHEAFPASPDTIPDVTIRFGELREELPKDEGFIKARADKSWWWSVPDETRTIFVCAHGLFDIRNGNEIFVSPYPDADDELIKIFILGSAMGAIQAQRGRIPLHGGAISTDRGALIISGGQGAGKSSMTSAFVHNGYHYLTDDVSSVSIIKEQVIVIPAYPQRKLVRDACAPLKLNPDDLVLVDGERDKLAIRDRDNWRQEPTELWAIIELYPLSKEEKVSAEPITGHAKLSSVTRNLYRTWMHLPGGIMKPDIFKKILTIAEKAKTYRVGVPRDIDNIAGIARDVASALEKQ